MGEEVLHIVDLSSCLNSNELSRGESQRMTSRASVASRKYPACTAKVTVGSVTSETSWIRAWTQDRELSWNIYRRIVGCIEFSLDTSQYTGLELIDCDTLRLMV